MKKFHAITTAVVCILSLLSCSVEPSDMVYGSDVCHFCKMTIVDQQHAAQIVTKKGKPYKFDAIECMTQEVRQVGTDKIAIYLVSDYSNPGKLIPANEARYLISPVIKSPMGANLTAFHSLEKASSYITKGEGNILSWSELLSSYKVQ